MKVLPVVLTFFGILLPSLGAPKPDASGPLEKVATKTDPTLRSVTEVSDVQVETNEGGKTLIVRAKGQVSSGGWENPTLVKVFYISSPTDGIYELEFRAKPPAGMATQAITPIEAKLVWKDFPSTVKGVRVTGMRNAVSKPVTAVEAK